MKKSIILLIIVAAAFCNRYAYIYDLEDNGSVMDTSRDIVMPPSLALITVALGPVRGLIVDALWWKVSELQDSEGYFEILRITDWITVMEPRNAFVWTFHAWNLAYNISHEFPTPESRWKWVYSGIKLLRDEGLKINPGNEFIESELALLFLDRVEGYSDPARRFFIRQWADEMEKYLQYGNRNELEKLADATGGLYKTRAENIEKKLKLYPPKMLEVDKEFGPFQWKLPQAQAVYWGERKNVSEYSQGYQNYRTIVISAMQRAFLFGGLVEDKKGALFVTTNNFDITDNIIRYYRKEIKESLVPERDKNLYNNFIIHAAPILYAFDHKKQAEKLFLEYKWLHPSINVDLKTFIGNHLYKMKKSSQGRYHQSLVEISLFSGYLCLIGGDFKAGGEYYAKAKKRWQEHQDSFALNPVMRMPPLEDLKSAAFVKVLERFPASQKKKLIALVHNKMAGDMRIKQSINFTE